MKQFVLRLVSLLVCSAGLIATSLGQAPGTGAISGTVTDSTGAVIEGATIKVIDQATGETRTAVSSKNGTYVVPLLPPATYRVETSKTGFKQLVREHVSVHITETATVNLQLIVGAIQETVTVTASPELLKTGETALGQVVDEREVNSLPLVSRDYTQILGLSPGVSAEVFNAAELGHGGINDSLVSNGSHSSDNNFQMNGVEINDLFGAGEFSGGIAIPNPDSLQEFKVQTSQYDASYGRDAGANVNVLTKSGTNSYHGNVWEFFRNQDLNANSFFNKETGQPRGVLRQNEFGFTFGGPIKKDKLLFFTSYQGNRQSNGIDQSCSSSVVLPVLTSDRSAAGLAASAGPATAVYAGGDITGTPLLPDGSTVSPQAQALFNLKLPNGQFVIPNPQITKTAGGLPYGFSTFSIPCPYNEDQFIADLDWLQSSKSTFQGRFFFENSNETQSLTPGALGPLAGSLPGSPASLPTNFRNFSLTHTYLFSARLVNQAEIGFHRTFAKQQPSSPFTYSEINSTVPDFDNDSPSLSVEGGFNTGGLGQGIILGQNTYVFQDTLSWIHGRHSFTFGGGLTRAQDNLTKSFYPGYSIFLNYPGLLIGDFLNPLEAVDQAGLTGRNWRVRDTNLYVQDNVKVTPRLTLNLGFRYERLGGFGEINGRNSSFDLSMIDPNPPASGSLAGLVLGNNFPGTLPAGVTTSGNDLGYKGNGQNTLNPRVGFAWSLPGTSRLVLRGGYGVFHQRQNGLPFLQQTANQPYGDIRVIYPDFGGFANPIPPGPGAFPQFMPYSPATLQSPLFLDQNLRPPVFQKYSLGLQTQLAKDFVLEVAYAGMRGTHMLVGRSVDQASLASPSNPIRGETTNTYANIQLRVPYEGFSASGMVDFPSTGFAWYNSLQASLTKRFSHGLQFLASYTFARDLANVQGSTTAGYNGSTFLGDQNNPRRNYGPDSFVRPQRFVVSAVYDLPGPKERTSLTGQLLGGWRLAEVTTIQSGHLLSVGNNNTYNVYGILNDFAEIVPGCHVNNSGSVTHKLDNWINQNCFFSGGAPIPYPVIGDDGFSTGFGNSSTGIVHGPDAVNTDLSVIKLFPLKWRERANVEFRAEFFNVFNHPIFSDPATNIAAGPTFGEITTTASNPRIIQFALKLNF